MAATAPADRFKARILTAALAVDTSNHAEAVIVGAIAQSLAGRRSFDPHHILFVIGETADDLVRWRVLPAPIELTRRDLIPWVARFKDAYETAVLP